MIKRFVSALCFCALAGGVMADSVIADGIMSDGIISDGIMSESIKTGGIKVGGEIANGRWFNDKDLTLTGVYYYPEHWDESQWERDFKRMHDLGFEFTHFAEFAWAQLEPQEGKYDFAWLDRAIALAHKYDLKVILCTSTATPPVWLSRKYPEILIRQENGTVIDHGARQHASFASPLYKLYSKLRGRTYRGKS